MKRLLIGGFFCFALFSLNAQTLKKSMLLLKETGIVVIGDTSKITTPGDYSLYVEKGVLTEKVKVSLKSTADWSDDAFTKTPTLESVAKSINEKSHLVEMPSATSLVKSGYELKSMDAKLLQQIEWLWQHMITLKNENEALRKSILKLQEEKK
jgi:trimeric autotransporter adhesin